MFYVMFKLKLIVFVKFIRILKRMSYMTLLTERFMNDYERNKVSFKVKNTVTLPCLTVGRGVKCHFSTNCTTHFTFLGITFIRF